MAKAKITQAKGINTKGLAEMVSELRSLQNVVVSQRIADLLGEAANGFRSRAIALAKAQNWPRETLETSFVDSRWPQSRRGKSRVSVLFGFRKQYSPGYVEWGPGTFKSPSRGPYSASPPRKFGMSLATLYEFGGERSVNRVRTWLPARPAYRPALAQYKRVAKLNIESGMRSILKQYIGEYYEDD